MLLFFPLLLKPTLDPILCISVNDIIIHLVDQAKQTQCIKKARTVLSHVSHLAHPTCQLSISVSSSSTVNPKAYYFPSMSSSTTLV